MVSAFPKICLEAEHFAKSLSLGSVFESPLFDRSENGARSRTAVCSQDFFEARFEWPRLDDISLVYFTERWWSGHGQSSISTNRRFCRFLWRNLDLARQTAHRDDMPSPLNAAKSLRVTKAKVIPRRNLRAHEMFLNKRRGLEMGLAAYEIFGTAGEWRNRLCVAETIDLNDPGRNASLCGLPDET